jgi:hypothetical protein
MLFESGKIMSTLKEHERLCEIRYAAVEKRLESVETKIDEIHKIIDGFKDFLLGLAVKSALAVLVVVCGAVFVIKL